MTGKLIIARLLQLADRMDQGKLFPEADALTKVAQKLAFYGYDEPQGMDDDEYSDAAGAAEQLAQAVQSSPLFQRAMTADDDDPQYQVLWSQIPALVKQAVHAYNQQSSVYFDPDEIVQLVMNDPDSDLASVLTNKVENDLSSRREDQEYMRGYDD